MAERRMKHKKTGLPKGNKVEYYTYRNMLSRCFDKNHKSFCNYGGKGITVCERWLGPDGFGNFLCDMGNRPAEGYSLDRIDNDKSYSPDNCRWATWLTQEGNRSINNETVGVSRHNQNGGWSAYISVGGRRKTKCFRTREEAVAQRKAWETSLV